MISKEEIKRLDDDIRTETEECERKKQELLRKKLQYLSENEDDERAHLTTEEARILRKLLLQHKNDRSVKMVEEWYLDIDGKVNAETMTIIRLGNKYLLIDDNIFSQPITCEVYDELKIEDGNMYYGIPFGEYNRGADGREQIIGGEDELSEPLDIDSLFADRIIEGVVGKKVDLSSEQKTEIDSPVELTGAERIREFIRRENLTPNDLVLALIMEAGIKESDVQSVMHDLITAMQTQKDFESRNGESHDEEGL